MKSIFRSFPTILAAAAALCLFCGAARAEFQGQINLVASDGTVLIYAGKDAGLKKGDAYDVSRNGARIGAIEIVEVGKAFSRAKVSESTTDVQEGDAVGVVPAPAAAPAKASQAPASAKSAGGPRASKMKTLEEDEKSAKKDDEDGEKKEVEKKEKAEKKEKSKKDDDEKEEKAEGAEAQPKAAERVSLVPAVGVAVTGLSGLQIVESAGLIEKGRAVLNATATDFNGVEIVNGGAAASNAKVFGVTYGFSERLEISLANAGFDMVGGGNANATMLGMKFKLNQLPLMKQKAKGGSKDYLAAVGFRYMDREDEKLERLFAALTMKAYQGSATMGVYKNMGDALPKSLEGFGLFGGYEFNLTERARLLVEFEDKDFYRNQTKEGSVGLRYQFAEDGLLDLNLSKPSMDSIISLGATYGI